MYKLPSPNATNVFSQNEIRKIIYGLVRFSESASHSVLSYRKQKIGERTEDIVLLIRKGRRDSSIPVNFINAKRWFCENVRLSV